MIFRPSKNHLLIIKILCIRKTIGRCTAWSKTLHRHKVHNIYQHQDIILNWYATFNLDSWPTLMITNNNNNLQTNLALNFFLLHTDGLIQESWKFEFSMKSRLKTERVKKKFSRSKWYGEFEISFLLLSPKSHLLK